MVRKAEQHVATGNQGTDPVPPQLSAQMLTAQELAAHLRVNRSTVYRLLKKGQLPGFRIGSEWRFQVEEIERWFKKHTGSAT